MITEPAPARTAPTSTAPSSTVVALTIVLGVLLSLVSAVTSTAPAAALQPVTVERLAGSNRYETARLTALAAFPSGAPEVILATGTNFPDALASSYLAGVLGAPVLLTEPDRLSLEAEEGILRLGSSRVTVLGNANAIGEAVTARLTALGRTVHRIGGADRFETAALIARSQPATPVGTPGGQRTAVVASGANFPDALAAGPLAYDFGVPVLLTAAGTLSAPVAGALGDLGIQRVLLLGGTAAVASGVQDAIAALGITVERVQGPDRFATADAIARVAQGFGWAPAQLVLATGRNFPDALAAGPLGGVRQAPIALTDGPTVLPAATAALCTHLRPTVDRLQVQGSVAVVGDPVVDECKGALEAPGGGGGGGGGCSAPGTEDVVGRARITGGAAPTVSRSVNSNGGTNTVERIDTGRYLIRFGCLGVDGGVVHATATDQTLLAQCNVLPWSTGGTATLTAEVLCFDDVGNPVNADFDVLFTRPKASSAPLAHGFFRTGAALPPVDLFNSTGATNTVTRLTDGSYVVDLPGLGVGIDNGSVVVSTYGATSGSCYAAAWGSAGTTKQVQVLCVDHAGNRVDRSFVLSYLENGALVPTNAGPSAYLWATPAIPPGPYTANPDYAFNGAGGAITVDRPGTGTYRVVIGGAASSGGQAHVTVVAPTATDVHCMVDRNEPAGVDQQVDVFCYDASTHAPVDIQFTLAYLA